MAKNEENNFAPDTIIGATVKVEGDLVSEGDIRVEGVVTGKVKTSKNLYVGENAKIEADVEAGSAMLSGYVKGDIKIQDSLVLSETGRVAGNITCLRLTINEGANFTGNCSMPEVDEAALAEEAVETGEEDEE